jgi:hypothetical protein
MLDRLKAANGTAELFTDLDVLDRGVDEVAPETESIAEPPSAPRSKARASAADAPDPFAMSVAGEGDQVTRKRRRAPSTDGSGASVVSSRRTACTSSAR